RRAWRGARRGAVRGVPRAGRGRGGGGGPGRPPTTGSPAPAAGSARCCAQVRARRGRSRAAATWPPARRRSATGPEGTLFTRFERPRRKGRRVGRRPFGLAGARGVSSAPLPPAQRPNSGKPECGGKERTIMKGYIDGLDNPGLQQRYGDRLHSRVRLQQGRGQRRTTRLTARSLCSRLLTIMAAVALVAVGAAPACADMCMGAKLKALGNKEAGLLMCQATNAAKPDTLKLAACESKAMGKFGPACSAAGACSGVCSTCESNADSCESSVSAAITDAATLKAASKLVKAELKCYTNAAKKSVPVDTVTCLQKAQGKFTGTPTQRNTVEMDCVDNEVTTNGGGSPPTGMVTAICSSGGPTTGDGGATLTSGDPVTGGYDFDTRTYTGLTAGDLYFSQGAFW